MWGTIPLPLGHDYGKWGTIPLQLKKRPTSQRNLAPHPSGTLPHFKRNQCPTSTGIRSLDMNETVDDDTQSLLCLSLSIGVRRELTGNRAHD
jgi:hypothetical protein